MKIPLPQYWDALTRSIQAQSEIAGIFLRHASSLGTAREAILRKIIRQQTPSPFKVQTGFVHKYEPKRYSSRQCDILVFDPRLSQPDYEIDDLAVVDNWATKAVVEVKSKLNQHEFKKVNAVWRSLSWLAVPTFAIAYKGVSFDTFVGNLVDQIKEKREGLPNCIAVLNENYIFLRSDYTLAHAKPYWHRPAKFQFAVNLNSGTNMHGEAFARFMDLYLSQFESSVGKMDRIIQWFNDLQLPHTAKVQLDFDGTVTHGQIL
jgi:hypothetical protein